MQNINESESYPSSLAADEQDLDRLQDKLKATEEEFEAVMGFYRFTGEAQQELTPSYFFGIWGNFLEDFKNYWKVGHFDGFL